VTTRRVVLLLVALTLVLSAGLRIYRLGTPPDLIFDEVYYAKDAQRILAGELSPPRDFRWEPGQEVSWPHPEMGKIAIAMGIADIGNRSWGSAAGCIVGWRPTGEPDLPAGTFVEKVY